MSEFNLVIRLQKDLGFRSQHTQRIPVESLTSDFHFILDSADFFSQHNGLHLIQAVQCRVVTVDKPVQVVRVPKYKMRHMSKATTINRLIQTLFLNLFIIPD